MTQRRTVPADQAARIASLVRKEFSQAVVETRSIASRLDKAASDHARGAVLLTDSSGRTRKR
jgi:hypothetical protein